MKVQEEFRRCLMDVDIRGIVRVWKFTHPHLPEISSDWEALVIIHLARTESTTVPPPLRQYSHCWLTDRNLPSKLPDDLKPNADQAGSPRIVDSVGISVNSPEVEVVEKISKAMQYAVLEAYGNNERNPHFIKQRMLEARIKERRALGLRNLPQ